MPTPSPTSIISANRQSSLAMFKDILPRYFASQWSFSHIKLPEGRAARVAFSADGASVVVLCLDDARYYKFSLAGECEKKAVLY